MGDDKPNYLAAGIVLGCFALLLLIGMVVHFTGAFRPGPIRPSAQELLDDLKRDEETLRRLRGG